MTEYVVGVDGCRGGWLACVYTLEPKAVKLKVFPTFKELLCELSTSGHIAIDIPIGLPNDAMPRACDVEARTFIGPRRSSVFPTPPRCLLSCETIEEAREISLDRFQRSISNQAFAIMPKIKEVDTEIAPETQDRVFEVHPEVCFREMARRALENAKRSQDGYNERREIVKERMGLDLPDVQHWRKSYCLEGDRVQRDDVLDAIAAAWTARRKLEKKSRTIPTTPQKDERGLRMEIVI